MILGVHYEFDWNALWPLVILLAISTLIPVILSICRIKFIPVFVVEIICGIIIAHIPATRDLFLVSHEGTFVFNGLSTVLYVMGMAFLLFISGLDTDFSVLKKTYKKNNITLNPFKWSWILITSVIVISVLSSFIFWNFFENKVFGVLLMSITLSSTFASLVIPLVHSENLSETTIGKIICTYSSVAELLSILGVSALLIARGAEKRFWLLIVIIIILVATYLVRKIVRISIFKDQLEGIVFLSIRLTILIMLGLVIITYQSGAEFILGAFLSGMVIKATNISHKSCEKLEAIGYGLFIPLFYLLLGVNVGVSVDFTNWYTIVLILGLFVALVLTKLPFLVLLKWYPLRTVIPTVFTVSCTIIVAIACEHFGVFTDNFSNALIVASALTCIFPPIFFAIDKKYGTSRAKYDAIIIDPHDLASQNHEN